MIEDAFCRVYNKRNQEQKFLRLKFKKMLNDLFETKMIGRVLNSIYTETYTSEVMDVVSRYMSVDVIKPLKDDDFKFVFEIEDKSEKPEPELDEEGKEKERYIHITE